MHQNSREQRILKQISSLKKSGKKKDKQVVQKSKVETSADTKTAMMLSILDNKSLKSGEKISRVFEMLQDGK